MRRGQTHQLSGWTPRKKGGLVFDDEGRRRDGSPTQRRRTFTPEMWHRWLADRMPDAHTEQLRAGIDDLRRSFAMKTVEKTR